MSEIKPVYQSQTDGVWHDVTDKEYAFRRELSGVYKTRIIYPAADYEALKEKLERLNGLYHSEVSKHQLDYNALKAENEELKNTVTRLKGWLKVWEGFKCNESQAKRLEEIKGFLEACADDSMSRNNRQQLAGELLDMLNGDSK